MSPHSIRSIFTSGYPTHETIARFWSKVEVLEAGCWQFHGTLRPEGYGRYAIARRMHAAHRVAYELIVGPIPDGLVLDHLCRNHGRVNPAHLEPVSMRDNLMRGEGAAAKSARMTHCPKGHPYDEQNLSWRRRRDGRLFRGCRACIRQRNHINFHARQAREVQRLLGRIP